MKREAKTKEQIEAEKQETNKLLADIRKLLTRVPESVMAGSYQLSVKWKEAARKGVQHINRQTTRLKLNDLRAVHKSLKEFSK